MFFFNDTATTEIYTLSLHDALPIFYRLAQESVTNARRHARHATQVTVAVTGEDDRVRLTIDDDGSAAGGRAPAGYGLVGMRERAALLGGTFSAEIGRAHV